VLRVATASQQAAAVAVRTRTRLALLALAGMLRLPSAAADDSPARRLPTSAEVLGREPRWRVQDARFRFSVFSQAGHGYQSRTGPIADPGSERALILQPIGAFSVRQSPTITHDVVIPIDVVSSASENAVDVVSSASAVNEAAGIELTNRFQLSPADEFYTLLGYNHEEPLSSGAFGFGFRRSLADDNAKLSISGQATIDRFKNIFITGKKRGERNRTTLGINLGFLQLLSETTVLELGYGGTYQEGTLQTTYLSVPLADGRTRIPERFPHTRWRHAGVINLAQHIVASRTTLRPGYRYYRDDFGITAHTAEISVYQYLTSRVVIGPSYRYYVQTGADFFGTSFPVDVPRLAPRTSDSDLADFHAHRYGLKLLLLPNQDTRLDAGYFYYARSNDLRAHIVTLGMGASF
jgi:hypothetical protein